MRPFLSLRQQEVLEWIARGKTSTEIGLILGLSEMTVDNHVRRIFKKLGTSSRVCAVVEAIQHGLIVLDMSKAHVTPSLIAPEPKSAPKRIFTLEGITVYDTFEVEIGVVPPPRRDVIHKRPYDLLRFLADPLGRFHTRQAILDAVWGQDMFIEERTVDVHVRSLRKLLEGCPYAVKTERSMGYQLVHL